MRVVIDREEGDWFIIELPSGKTIPVLKELFPEGKEGATYCIRKEERQSESVGELFKKLTKKNP